MTPEQYWSGIRSPWPQPGDHFPRGLVRPPLAPISSEADRAREMKRLAILALGKICDATCVPAVADNWHESPDALGPTGL